MHRRSLVLIVAALAIMASACETPRPDVEVRYADLAQKDSWQQPWEGNVKHPPIAHRDPATWEDLEPTQESASGGDSTIIGVGYAIYTNHITKVDGARCEHRPTCSRYAFQAVRKHGMLVGSWMAIDRLFFRTDHSSSLKKLPLHKFENGKPYFDDPVEEHDFFF